MRPRKIAIFPNGHIFRRFEWNPKNVGLLHHQNLLVLLFGAKVGKNVTNFTTDMRWTPNNYLSFSFPENYVANKGFWPRNVLDQGKIGGKILGLFTIYHFLRNHSSSNIKFKFLEAHFKFVLMAKWPVLLTFRDHMLLRQICPLRWGTFWA